jgi:hypothetical protein
VPYIPSKKGINSSLVRSAPSARAIVESRCIAFNRKRTSSCYIVMNKQGQKVVCFEDAYNEASYL